MVQARLIRIVLALLAIGLVTCNGSMEMETATYELGESSGYGDEDQQEIDTIGGDEDDGLSNYDVESEDQEERVGVANVNDFDSDEPVAKPKKRMSHGEKMRKEIEQIQDEDDSHGDIGEGGPLVEPTHLQKEAMPRTETEATEAASTGVEKIQKEAERHQKAADKAFEKRSKMDEIKVKEADARAAAKKKEEARTKERRTKAQNRAEEAGEKQKVEDKAAEEARQEAKKKDNAKTAEMEKQLKKARKESEADAKKEQSEELKDKAYEHGQKQEERKEQKSKAKSAADMKAQAEEKTRKQKEAFEAEVKADKKKEAAVEAEQKNQLKMELEKKKTSISEKGDKAYNNELSLETKRKKEMQEENMRDEKTEKKKEKGSKADLIAEAEQKMAEVQTKSDERDQKIDRGNADVSVAKEGAAKGEENEIAKKAKAKHLASVMKRRAIEVQAIEFQTEHAQKDLVRAFTATEKKEAEKNKKMMDSKLSEIISKHDEDKKSWKAAITVREMSGKMSREKAQKAARVAATQLKHLKDAKKDAVRKLSNARKARAEVDLMHAKVSARDAATEAAAAASKESSLKVEVANIKKRTGKMIAQNKKEIGEENQDLTVEQQEQEKAKKFMETHHEGREKDVELADQKVQKWISSDWKLDNKVKRMESWSDMTDEASNKKVAEEMKAKAKVRQMQSGFERAKKKKGEIREKETMNRQFKEMLRKDDEKEKQEAEKKIQRENEKVQKEEDRKERADERVEKADEIDGKALVKEKESAEKSSEAKTKKKNTSDAADKAISVSVLAQKTFEGQQKREVSVAQKLADAKGDLQVWKAALTKKGMTKSEMENAKIKVKDAAAKLSMALSEHEDFSAKMQKSKDDMKEKEVKAKELVDHKDAINKSFEQKTKREAAAKHTVVKDQEAKAKKNVKAIANRHKVNKAQAAARHEARKAKRIAEKGAKDVQTGRNKDEREKKDEEKENAKMQEKMGKKGDAQVKAIAAAANAKQAAKDAKVAMKTLDETLKQRKAWKVELKRRQEVELQDREKEMKTVPKNILIVEEKNYRGDSAKLLKIKDKAASKAKTSAAQWKNSEQFVKQVQTKELGIKDEKKELVKTLGEAVREEYKVGKTLKKQRAQMDADERKAGRTKLKLIAEEKLAVEQRQKIKDDKEALAESSKALNDEKEASANKLQGLSAAEQSASSDEQEQEMRADVSTGSKRSAANARAKADSDKAMELEKDKAATAKESAEKEQQMAADKVKRENALREAEAAMDEAKSKRDETQSILKTEKETKKQDEMTMKQDEKRTTGAVRDLRRKEMDAKHNEITSQSRLQTAGSKEQELLAVKTADAAAYRRGNELYGKKFTKLKMARKILEKLVDNAEARENKESASKNLLSQQKNEMDKHKETVKKTEEKSEKSHKASRSAQRAKAHADNELERASNSERNSKHNALERTKKHEASAIRRAVEKKNKAGEIESKAYEKSAEQRKKQYVRAKSHRSAIIKSLDKFIKARDVLTQKYGLSDLLEVTKMERRNEEKVGAAENGEKHAIKSAAETSDVATTTGTKAQEMQVKLDKAKAILKKASDLYDARERSREAAKKAQAVALKENVKKSTQKAFLHADGQAKKSLQKKEEAMYTVHSAQQRADKAVTLEQAAREAAAAAAQEQLKASNRAAAAKQAQESAAKQGDRFRTLSTMISEREQKRRSSTIAVQQDEKTYKSADDDFKNSAANCEKTKSANQNIGKAYNKLKLEMKRWSMQNPWLKQDDDSSDEEMGESKSESAVEGVDSATDVVAQSALEGGDDGGEMPTWARRSFVELLQQDYGTDVTGMLKL